MSLTDNHIEASVDNSSPAKYKFYYMGQVYYVNRESEDMVFAHSSKNDLKIKKSELAELYDEGEVDFFCQTEPDFIAKSHTGYF